jgi:hypothetical protein
MTSGCGYVPAFEPILVRCGDFYSWGDVYSIVSSASYKCRPPNSSILSKRKKKHTATTMRASLIYTATLFSLGCLSFPTTITGDISEDTLAEYVALAEKITREAEVKRGSSSKRAFNADAQRIDTTGEHAYVRTRFCSGISQLQPLTDTLKTDGARP